MSAFQHLELLSLGPVSRVRLLGQRAFGAEYVAELTEEWNSVADLGDCQALYVDCSNVPIMSSEMLSKLILLQRRLREKQARLVLAGLRAEVREVLSWTKLDHFFEIDENKEQEIATSA